MATAHLYECDDVAATLLYAFMHGKPRLGIQACNELLASEEYTYLFQLLVFAWFLTDPINSYESAVATAFMNQDAKSIALMLAEIGPIVLPDVMPIYDVALPKACATSGCVADSAWHTWPRNWTAAMASTFFKAVRISLQSGYWQHAAYITIPLLATDSAAVIDLLSACNIPIAFSKALDANVYAPLAPRILMHAFASAVAKPNVLKSQWTNLYGVQNSIGIGKKHGRTFTVPCEALAYWHRSSSHTIRLMGPPCLIVDATACWQRIVDKYDIKLTSTHDILLPSDDMQESFYTDCFPDDIPDEWSEVERAKSHGGIIPEFIQNPWITAFHLCGS